jgi:hypothetical protein
MVSTPGFLSFDVEMDKAFAEGLKKAQDLVEDLRPALKDIAADFYRSQKAIFKLSSAGGYPDFKISSITTKSGRTYTPSESPYRARKKKMYGFDYPLMKATGNLERSVTSPNGKGSIYRLEKQSLEIGSSLSYLEYHQSDEPRQKMPLRKVLFIGPEARNVSDSDIQGRLPRWLKILNTYVLRSMGATSEEAIAATSKQFGG